MPMPDRITDCPLALTLSRQLRSGREELVKRWLERIADRVNLHPNRIFPTEELLDHVPLLVDGIADYLADPAVEISAEVPVVAKAMELGELRHQQGFDAYQILKEYEILGGILFNYLIEAVDEIEEPCSRGDLLACGHRLFRAIALIQQVTTTHFLRQAERGLRDREARLRSFNRALSHEFKNRIGAALGANELIAEGIELDPQRRAQLAGIVTGNLRDMQGVIENLLDLVRVDDARRQRHVRLPRTAWESARQLRESAEAAGVEIRIGELPDVEVNAAAVELCFSNFLSNAIKYADPGKTPRWVEVSGSIQPVDEGDGCEMVIRVQDNGLGVPPESRPRLFQRYFRAEEVSDHVEGTGLGLSIVQETVASLGGRAWAEFPEEGAVFAFALPCRRAADPAPAGA